LFSELSTQKREEPVNLAADRQLLYIGCIISYMNEVRPLEAQDELWEELEETLKPILGENYMLSIADGSSRLCVE
jgi:hypothetical protein